MKKKILSLALALTMCLGLMVPALAAEPKAGDATVTVNGGTYSFSNPILGTEFIKFDYDSFEAVEEAAKTDPSIAEEFQFVKSVFVNMGIVGEAEEGITVVLIPVGTVMTAPTMDSRLVSQDGDWLSSAVGNFHRVEFSDKRIEKEYWAQTIEDKPGDYTFVCRDICKPGDVSCILSDEGQHLFVKVVDEKTTTPETPTEPEKPVNPGTTTKVNFTDVKESDWFYNPVQWAIEKEITSGTTETTFSPKKDCTVAEILMFLYKAYGAPEVSGNPYANLNADSWYAAPAIWAHEKGLVTGTTFNAATPCTRSMAVTYLWKLAGSPEAKAASFADVPAAADYAKAVNWAVEKGVTAGVSETQFGPDVVCTRSQIVTFLYSALAK